MDYVVYRDQTGHLPCGQAAKMILGALLVPRERLRPLTLQLREHLARLGWSRITAGGWAEWKRKTNINLSQKPSSPSNFSCEFST